MAQEDLKNDIEDSVRNNKEHVEQVKYTFIDETQKDFDDFRKTKSKRSVNMGGGQ